MIKRKIDFKEFFNAGDVLAILVIIAGILLSIFIDDIAIKMIGISVALLGAIALFMLISQRLTDIVDSKAINNKNKKEYHVTTTYDSTGVRKTVENFDYSLNDDELYPKKTEEKSEIKISIDEKKVNDDYEKETLKEENSVEIKKENEKSENNFNIYNDSYSSVRIVGTYKHTKKNENENSDIKEIKSESEISEEINNKKSEESNQSSIAEVENINKISNIGKGDYPNHYFLEKDILIGDEPKVEFDYFISRILIIIKSLTDTNSAFLILVDNKKENFTIESYASDIKIDLSERKKYPISTDIISQIILNSKPEILTEINPISIKDLIPFYTNEHKVKSFIGIPVIWNENVIAVLTADSEAEDAYDSTSVSLMGQFTKLISGLIKSYTHKIDLLEASKTLELISRFQSIALTESFNLEKFYESVCLDISNIFNEFTVGISVYDYDKDSWRINYVKSKNYSKKDVEFNMFNTLLGKTIITGENIYKSGIDIANIIRTHSEEEQFKTGEFLSVPIKTQSGVYGALFIETTPRNYLTDFDISVLEILANHLGGTIERINLIKLYQTSAIKDKSTGLYNSTAFFEKMTEEIERFNECNDKKLSLILFKIDKYSSIDPVENSERLELAKNNVINIAKKYFKKYEPIGKVDADTYGALVINKDITQVKLIGERFRNEVANSMIEFDNKKFNVTLSIGISHYSSGLSLNTFFSNTISALSMAMEINNYVQVYN